MRWVAALPSVLVLLTALPPPITGQATEYSGEIIVDGGVEDLVGISSIVPFDDGSIAVGQGQDHRVIVFGPDGARRAVLGRAGGGPGEFRDLSSRSGRAGQLVWVWDRSARRLTLLDARGRLVRTTQAPIALSSPDGVTQPGIAASQPLALGPDGGLLLLLTVPRAMMSLRGWEDLQGHRTGSVWVTDGRRGTVVAGWPTATETCGTDPAQQTNCPVPRVAAGPDGRLLVIVSVEPDGSAQGTFAVRAFGRDGRLRFESHLRYTTIAVPDRVIDSMRTIGTAPGLPADRIRYWRDATFRTFYPPFTDVFIGQDDRTWIRLGPGRDSVDYLILDQRGRSVGTVTVPASSTIEAADATRFWATTRDEDGIESVARYRLR